MSEQSGMIMQKRMDRDGLIIKLLGYGAAALFVYFALDDLNKPDSSWWPGFAGAIIFAGLGHLVSWAVSRIPEKPKTQ